MKKIILLGSIALTLLSMGARAQTVLAQGKRVTLTANDKAYLLSVKNSTKSAMLYNAITSVLSTRTDIRCNDTADMILSVLAKRNKSLNQFAKK